MSQPTPRAASPEFGGRCYRLTARGRACVEVVESGQQTVGSLSRYLHDVLLMCGSGAWFEQLRQAVPPRSLEESLRSLMALGLIEALEPANAPSYEPPRTHQPRAAFGRLAA